MQALHDRHRFCNGPHGGLSRAERLERFADEADGLGIERSRRLGPGHNVARRRFRLGDRPDHRIGPLTARQIAARSFRSPRAIPRYPGRRREFGTPSRTHGRPLRSGSALGRSAAVRAKRQTLRTVRGLARDHALVVGELDVVALSNQGRAIGRRTSRVRVVQRANHRRALGGRASLGRRG